MRATSMLVLAIVAWCGAASSEELTGKLVERRAARLALVPDAGARSPGVGARATLSKHFVKNLGFLKTQGWLEIAVVSVKETGRRIVLTIIEEKSKMKVNGKPVDHFKPGAKVKLVWGG